MLNEHFCATGSAVVSAALMLVGSVQAGYADSLAVIDGGTASGLCATSYPGTTGPDQLSSCQWDMRVIMQTSLMRSRPPVQV